MARFYCENFLANSGYEITGKFHGKSKGTMQIKRLNSLKMAGPGHHHHHNRIFDLRAGAGASSTSVGPFPGNWLAARIADLTPDLQVLLS